MGGRSRAWFSVGLIALATAGCQAKAEKLGKECVFVTEAAFETVASHCGEVPVHLEKDAYCCTQLATKFKEQCDPPSQKPDEKWCKKACAAMKKLSASPVVSEAVKEHCDNF